ncbi:MAG: DUF1737 domain-containing protein [Phreatobacter sp.]|uniref:DUF1737 domain-containing protein n=1 Tax=Phreatobacter sp. TaxID=1966341 RepID=UPI002732BFA1|nr:DUF1737 domain-containing protein [Phreatobacter sp.]MDP2801140.1 DUF1737 domain-containing protein [Phreatobacter sp.]
MLSVKPKSATTLYRYLTGPDDSAFCHRVSEAINKGWQLYGPPTLTFDAAKGRVICGQAIVREVEDVAYSPDLKLSDF